MPGEKIVSGTISPFHQWKSVFPGWSHERSLMAQGSLRSVRRLDSRKAPGRGPMKSTRQGVRWGRIALTRMAFELAAACTETGMLLSASIAAGPGFVMAAMPADEPTLAGNGESSLLNRPLSFRRYMPA